MMKRAKQKQCQEKYQSAVIAFGCSLLRWLIFSHNQIKMHRNLGNKFYEKADFSIRIRCCLGFT